MSLSPLCLCLPPPLLSTAPLPPLPPVSTVSQSPVFSCPSSRAPGRSGALRAIHPCLTGSRPLPSSDRPQSLRPSARPSQSTASPRLLPGKRDSRREKGSSGGRGGTQHRSAAAAPAKMSGAAGSPVITRPAAAATVPSRLPPRRAAPRRSRQRLGDRRTDLLAALHPHTPRATGTFLSLSLFAFLSFLEEDLGGRALFLSSLACVGACSLASTV